jgi:hypothetical protein
MSCFPEDEHNPALPVFVVSSDMMHRLLQLLPPKSLFDETPLRFPVHYASCFVIHGKKYIPFELHEPPKPKTNRGTTHGKKRKHSTAAAAPPGPSPLPTGTTDSRRYLLMVRVVSAFTYFLTYNVPTSLSLDPLYVTFLDQEQKGQLFCGIDEAIYVTESVLVEPPAPPPSTKKFSSSLHRSLPKKPKRKRRKPTQPTIY